MLAPLLLSILLAAGCSVTHTTTQPQVNSANEPNNEQSSKLTVTNHKTGVEAANGQASANESAQPSKQAEPAEKYYVDNKVFLIHAADLSNKQKIALLTFDDGPKGDSTRKILDTLDKYHAKAVWFISGFNYGPDYKPDPNKSENFKSLVLEIKNRGHIIGNHTWDHGDFKKQTPEKQRTEITQMNKLLESITGERPHYLRPPFGSYTDVMKAEVKQQAMQWMNWSVGSLDWQYTDPQKVTQQTVSTIYNGAVILMHDNEVEAKALDGTLTQLVEQEYKFVVPTEVKTEESLN